MTEELPNPVTCERCASFWRRTREGFGICASAARRAKTGEIQPEVAVGSTCEFAQISAKLDPGFMERVYEARRNNLPPEHRP